LCVQSSRMCRKLATRHRNVPVQVPDENMPGWIHMGPGHMQLPVLQCCIWSHMPFRQTMGWDSMPVCWNVCTSGTVSGGYFMGLQHLLMHEQLHCPGVPPWNGLELCLVLVCRELDCSGSTCPSHVCCPNLFLWILFGLVYMPVLSLHQLDWWLHCSRMSSWDVVELGYL